MAGRGSLGAGSEGTASPSGTYGGRSAGSIPMGGGIELKGVADLFGVMVRVHEAQDTNAVECMAVTTRFELKHDCALHFSGTQSFDDVDRHRIPGPRIHMR